MNAVLQVKNLLARLRFDDIFFSIPEDANIHAEGSCVFLFYFFNMQDGIFSDADILDRFGEILDVPAPEQDAVGLRQFYVLIVERAHQLIKALRLIHHQFTAISVIKSNKHLHSLNRRVIRHF